MLRLHASFPIILFLISSLQMHAATLHVGMGQPYANLEAAAAAADPGDTILIHGGTYSGGLYIENLQGTSADWIYILAEEGEIVIFDGGNNAWQFTDAAYLYISGFIFQHQVGNGLNFDDGGTYDTPAHDVIFDNCTFRDMNASGNNDLLKLSGLDDFEIVHCTFLNGSEGGSGIDMVGCHNGLIHQNNFENLGSNSIQAKGGTSNITIERNFFKNGGARALNLGGSTGLQFFRPIDAEYEAADLKVYSNIFIGSEAPIAFVGCINSEVVNNTLFLPDKWVMRILQETVDPDRFAPCGNNTFRNNIVYIDNNVNVEVNIGPNTAPETFTFSNNLWYHSQDPSWEGPDLPVPDEDNLVGFDPLFENAAAENFSLEPGSPAIGSGLTVPEPVIDYAGEEFVTPPSIGAFEGGFTISTIDYNAAPEILVYPNPGSGNFMIAIDGHINGVVELELFTSEGKVALAQKLSIENPGRITFSFDGPPDVYYLILKTAERIIAHKLIVID